MIQFTDLEPSLRALEEGGLILYPTDTVWSIGCDATNADAVARLKALRQLPEGHPLVILVADMDMLKAHAGFVHPRVETLLAHHQRPLTMVFDEGVGLPQEALGADGSVALRITKDPFCLQLIHEFGKPIVATAACIGAGPIPTHFGEVSSAVIENVDYVVRHRQMDKQMEEPSVIARLNDDEELDFIRE
jgi:L-threonylcarbamoyladenylate synthase